MLRRVFFYFCDVALLTSQDFATVQNSASRGLRLPYVWYGCHSCSSDQQRYPSYDIPLDAPWCGESIYALALTKVTVGDERRPPWWRWFVYDFEMGRLVLRGSRRVGLWHGQRVKILLYPEWKLAGAQGLKQFSKPPSSLFSGTIPALPEELDQFSEFSHTVDPAGCVRKLERRANSVWFARNSAAKSRHVTSFSNPRY